MASYDESLLASAPVATRAQLQHGYNADLLTEKPTPPQSTTNLNDLEAGQGGIHTHPPAVPSKEQLQQYHPQHKQPWWRTTKGIIIIVLVVVVIIAAVVGGAVGGSKKKKTNNVDLGGSSNSTISLPPALQTQTQAAGGDNSQGAGSPFATSTTGSPTATSSQVVIGPATDPNTGPTASSTRTNKAESAPTAVKPPDTQVDGGGGGTGTTSNTGTTGAGAGAGTNAAGAGTTSNGDGTNGNSNDAAQGGDPFSFGGIFDN